MNALSYEFEGCALTQLEIDGRPAWVAREVATAFPKLARGQGLLATDLEVRREQRLAERQVAQLSKWAFEERVFKANAIRHAVEARREAGEIDSLELAAWMVYLAELVQGADLPRLRGPIPREWSTPTQIGLRLGIARLAPMTSLGERTVRRALKQLRERGVLEDRGRTPRGGLILQLGSYPQRSSVPRSMGTVGSGQAGRSGAAWEADKQTQENKLSRTKPYPNPLPSGEGARDQVRPGSPGESHGWGVSGWPRAEGPGRRRRWARDTHLLASRPPATPGAQPLALPPPPAPTTRGLTRMLRNLEIRGLVQRQRQGAANIGRCT